jgi:hypothetical protein
LFAFSSETFFQKLVHFFSKTFSKHWSLNLTISPDIDPLLHKYTINTWAEIKFSFWNRLTKNILDLNTFSNGVGELKFGSIKVKLIGMFVIFVDFDIWIWILWKTGPYTWMARAKVSGQKWNAWFLYVTEKQVSAWLTRWIKNRCT